MKRSLHILIVEDDPALGPITSYGLRSCGYRSLLATTAQAAYVHLSEPNSFELVLLDLQLGDQRSEPLILQLRAEGFEIPRIVILSAQPPLELQQVADSIGAHGIVQKPATIQQIDAAIDQAAA